MKYSSKQLLSKLEFLLLWMLLPVMGQQAGIPIDNLPTWEERTLYVLINAARLNPKAYGDSYCSNSNPISGYGSLIPYIMAHGLNRAAHAHSVDMSSCNRLSHSSCDGTRAITRVRSYYEDYDGECVAVGPATSMRVLDAWLHSNSGHREAMVDPNATIIGLGHYKTSKHWWTTDFANEGTPRPANPLYGGSHLFLEKDSISFWVNFYTSSGTAPQALSLVLEGQTRILTGMFAKQANTTFSVEAPSADNCRTYHFLAVDGDGGRWRYPETGEFYTYGEGGCDKVYTPASANISFERYYQRYPADRAPEDGETIRLYSIDGRRVIEPFSEFLINIETKP